MSGLSCQGQTLCDRVLLPLLLLTFFCLSLLSAVRESVTIDEFRHLSTGVYYWQSGDFSFDGATPPLWKLALAVPAHLAGAKSVPPLPGEEGSGGWSPWLVATDFMRLNADSYTSFLTGARILNILAGCSCLFYLYLRAKKSFGSKAALYGAAFLAFSPTLLAHSHYATTDVIAALTVMVLVFKMIDLADKPCWGRVATVSILFSVALLCKFTAMLLLPLLACVIGYRSPELGGAIFRESGVVSRRAVRTAVAFPLAMLLLAGIFLFSVNLVYGFRDAGSSLTEIGPKSRVMQTLGMTAFGQLPLPLPRGFIEGFDHQKADSDYAEFPSYFNGYWSEGGFWYYYFGAFCLKETLPFLLLGVLTVFMGGKGADASQNNRELALLWYVPVILFLVLSFFNRLDVGVRYLLPAYPFLCYFFSRLFAHNFKRKPFRVFLLMLLLLHAASVIRIAPHFTAYFNEVCGGPAQGYRYLVDSNLDWGQDLNGLRKYMEREGIGTVQLAYFGHAPPELYGVSYEPLLGPPRPGYVAISASLLQGQPYLLTYLSPPFEAVFDHYRFMREFEPIAQVGYSMMVYRVK